MPEPRWAVVVHGGCKPIVPEREAANREGCLRAVEAGSAVLRAGGSAVEAVEAAIRVLEDDPTFNAGYGSVPNRDGEAETDAAIMDGTALRLGGVAAVRGVANPISLARTLLDEETVLLAGEGARRFADAHGVATVGPADLIPPDRVGTEKGADTVGCVALDRAGRLAAGTSTGGLTGKLSGRVGDSPLPGCGLYADDRSGAVSLTGEGERIARTLVAARVINALERGVEPTAAVEQGLDRLERVGGDAGAIAITPDGRIGWSHRGARMAVAWAASNQAPRSALDKQETSHG